MYKFIKIRHDIIKQCHGNYKEMTKFSYKLEIEIFRNSTQKKIGCPEGFSLKGLGVQIGTQTPCWLRPWAYAPGPLGESDPVRCFQTTIIMDLAQGHGCSNFFRGEFSPEWYMFFPIDRYFTHIKERSILNSTNSFQLVERLNPHTLNMINQLTALLCYPS